jgi:PIN domain nuclease of toxin-antitoxin system
MILDTHAVLWWIQDEDKIGAAGKYIIDNATAANPVFVSSITFWEIALLVQKERLELKLPVQQWLEKLASLEMIDTIPITWKIAARSTTLSSLETADPADRFIISSAIEHGIPILTKDEKIQKFSQVETIWD